MTVANQRRERIDVPRTERNETAPHIRILLRMVHDFCLSVARWIDHYYHI
jgi:hypothetical protein